MSGGRFEYAQHRIHDIANEMQAALDSCEVTNEEVRVRFREGIVALRVAAIHAQRADWLLSCDDGDEDYLERLHEELMGVAKECMAGGGK